MKRWDDVLILAVLGLLLLGVACVLAFIGWVALVLAYIGYAMELPWVFFLGCGGIAGMCGVGLWGCGQFAWHGSRDLWRTGMPS